MSSTQQEPQVQVRQERKSGGVGYGRLIAAAVVTALILFFVFQNTADVRFKFLFWEFSWPAWLMLLITLLIGFLVGMLVSALLRRRKKRQLRRRAEGY